MPYNYIGLGGARIKSDLQTMGAFSGSSTDILVSPFAPYSNGRSLLTNKAPTASGSVPGQTIDYFSYQLSSKTSGELYSEGRGWAVYWRAMVWINNSVTNNVTFDGTNWWLPTTNAVQGDFIGRSTDGLNWDFIEIPGASQSIANPSTTCTFKGVFGFTRYRSTTLTELYYLSNGQFVPVTLLSGKSSYFRGSASNEELLVLCGTAGALVYASDIAGPYTEVSAGSSVWNGVINLPGTSTWIVVGAGGSIGRTTDNFASTFEIQTPISSALYGVAASPTSVIVAGDGTNALRSVDQGATWTPISNFPSNVSGNFGAAAYGNGIYVLASVSSNYLAVSTDDGLTWTDVLSPTAGTVYRVNGFIFGNSAVDGLKFQDGYFWLCTSSNTANNYILARSKDGISWETVVTVYPKGGSYYNSVHGVFLAQNTSGVPTSASTCAGYTLSSSTATSYPILCLGNTGVSNASGVLMGINKWHEYQIIGRPATVPNEWNITYIVDGVDYGTYQSTQYAAKSDCPLWFNVHRSNYFTFTSDVVYYDFHLANDPGLLGPDLRIYYDQPATDVSVQWIPSVSGASNSEMVATSSITESTTYVSEEDTPKTDQYLLQPTSVPDTHKILSTKNTAYFSRLQTIGGINAQVGISIDGVSKDSVPYGIVAPVNSWTYISQQVDNNPQTGMPWTKTKLNEAQIRIRRASPSPDGDPYFGNVVLLAHFTGTAGQTSFEDSSHTQVLTASGAAALSSAQYKFAPVALDLNSVIDGSSYISIPFNDSLKIGSEDFTLDCWIYQTAAPSGVNTIFSFGNAGRTSSAYFYWGISTGKLRLIQGTGDGVGAFYTSATTVPLNQWVHVAIQRKSGTITSYVDGVQDSVIAVIATNYNFNSDYAFIGRPGRTNGAAYRFRGYIQDLRISKGVARYNGSFTVPDAPYPDYY